ncbi:MAG: hypothetical protein JWQ72_1840 [Polaromonas sp.]|nr:hypothetical protein [Polaromonas sp.]
MKKLLMALLLAGLSCTVLAKLPELSAEAKAKAAEADAKTAWSGKSDAYLLCQAQDKVAAKYFAAAKAAGKETKAPVAAPSCADPGPFAYTPAEQKPLESSGAHSPAGNATSPPSVNKPAAEMTPAKKS